MSKNYKLKQPIGPGYTMEPEDVLKTKTILTSTGHYTPPDFGITNIPDQNMISAVKAYQKDKNLKVDGIIKPDGQRSNLSLRWETRQKLLATAEYAMYQRMAEYIMTMFVIDVGNKSQLAQNPFNSPKDGHLINNSESLNRDSPSSSSNIVINRFFWVAQ